MWGQPFLWDWVFALGSLNTKERQISMGKALSRDFFTIKGEYSWSVIMHPSEIKVFI